MHTRGGMAALLAAALQVLEPEPEPVHQAAEVGPLAALLVAPLQALESEPELMHQAAERGPLEDVLAAPLQAGESEPEPVHQAAEVGPLAALLAAPLQALESEPGRGAALLVVTRLGADQAGCPLAAAPWPRWLGAVGLPYFHTFHTKKETGARAGARVPVRVRLRACLHAPGEVQVWKVWNLALIASVPAGNRRRRHSARWPHLGPSRAVYTGAAPGPYVSRTSRIRACAVPCRPESRCRE